MKPPEADEHLDAGAVVDACAAAGIAVTALDAGRLARHALLVIDANARLNLTAIVTREEMLWLHIVDSLAYLPLVGDLQEPLVDIGSGAGFPGIPLAVYCGLAVTLCEATKKKAIFLEAAAADVAANATVYAGRAEELAAARPAGYGTAVARAVGPTAALVELAAPLLRPGGRLLALKGGVDTADLSRADRAAAMCGMVRAGLWTYSLPARADWRCVVAYELVGEAAIVLPRRPGMAQRKPLG